MKSVVKEGIINVKNHKLWKGASGAIWFQLENGGRVCIASNGSGFDIGKYVSAPTSDSWKPFYGTVELSE